MCHDHCNCPHILEVTLPLLRQVLRQGALPMGWHPDWVTRTHLHDQGPVQRMELLHAEDVQPNPILLPAV